MKESNIKNVLRVILFPLLFVRKHFIIARNIVSLLDIIISIAILVR